MVKSLKDNYPEYERPYTQKRDIPAWAIILLFLTAISTATFTFLVWSETQYLNFFKEALKTVNEPIKISSPTISIKPKIIRTQQKLTRPTEKIYSWTDENGVRQFSNVQPHGNITGLTITESIVHQ